MTDKVYCIYRHISPSGKSYIGQTKNLKRRDKKHMRGSGCTAFQSAILKYGWDSFFHDILEDGLTLDQANEREEFYISELNTISPNGYNLRGGGLNLRQSEETKLRISLANTGKFRSEQSKQNIRAAAQGRALTEEHKRKISEAHLGSTRSDVTKDKLRETKIGDRNPMYGKEVSLETRNKLSLAKKGKTQSEEWVAKRVESNAGFRHTDESKLKMSEDRMGEKNHRFGAKHSEGTKAKMSDSATGAKNHRFGKCGADSASSKKYTITFPDGGVRIVVGMAEFCRNYGLSAELMRRIANGGGTQHKGFTCRYYENTDIELQDAA